MTNATKHRTHLKPLNISLGPIQFDEKRDYVESVCEILIESRCGPGRFDEFVYPDAAERRPDNYDFLDLMPVGNAVYYPSAAVADRYDEAQRTEVNVRMAKAGLDAKYGEIFHQSPAALARGPTDRTKDVPSIGHKHLRHSLFDNLYPRVSRLFPPTYCPVSCLRCLFSLYPLELMFLPEL